MSKYCSHNSLNKCWNNSNCDIFQNWNNKLNKNQYGGGLTTAQLWETYGKDLNEHFKIDNSARHLAGSNRLPEAFINADPDSKKKAVQWIITSYLDGGIRLIEDFNRVQVALTDYYYLLKIKAIDNKWLVNLNSFCGLIGCNRKNKFAEGLENFLQTGQNSEGTNYHDLLTKRDKNREITQKYKISESDYRLLYEDDIILVVVPLTENAACSFGNGTTWCTAMTKGENRFKYYNDRGTLYIIEPKNPRKIRGRTEKYQFHFDGKTYYDRQLMDQHDNDISDNISEIFKLYGKSILKAPELGIEFENWLAYNIHHLGTELLCTDPKIFKDYLVLSAFCDNFDNVKMLLEKGVNPNTTFGRDKMTALYIASLRGYFDIAKILLEYGANPNIQHQGQFAIQIAQLQGYTNIVELLLQHGADPNTKLLDSETLLMRTRDINSAKFLLELGADPNLQSKYGLNALIASAKHNLPDIFKLLLEYGADPDLKIGLNTIETIDTKSDYYGIKNKEFYLDLIKKHYTNKKLFYNNLIIIKNIN